MNLTNTLSAKSKSLMQREYSALLSTRIKGLATAAGERHPLASKAPKAGAMEAAASGKPWVDAEKRAVSNKFNQARFSSSVVLGPAPEGR
jgi:hypothetical protein